MVGTNVDGSGDATALSSPGFLFSCLGALSMAWEYKGNMSLHSCMKDISETKLSASCSGVFIEGRYAFLFL